MTAFQGFWPQMGSKYSGGIMDSHDGVFKKYVLSKILLKEFSYGKATCLHPLTLLKRTYFSNFPRLK